MLSLLDVLHFSVHVFVNLCTDFQCKYTHTCSTKGSISFGGTAQGKAFYSMLLNCEWSMVIKRM